MACKKKPGLTRKGMDEMGKAAQAAGEFVSEAPGRRWAPARHWACAVPGRPWPGAQMFKVALEGFDMVHKQAGRTMEKVLGDSDYVSDEAREVAKEWSRVVKVGRADSDSHRKEL